MKIILKNVQIQVCIDVLDFYSRMFMGQYEEIESLIWKQDGYRQENREYRFARKHILTAMRNLIFHNDPDIAEWDLHGSLGIWSERTDGRAKSAYDMQQVIRYADAWCRMPEGGMGRNFDAPDFGGELKPIECICTLTEEGEVAELIMGDEHIRLIRDAINVYIALLEKRIKDMMSYYTREKIVLSLAEILEKLFLEYESDKKIIKELIELREIFFIIDNKEKGGF